MGRVTLIGAGPVGLLMALLLARRGEQVCVYERRADPRRIAPESGRSINLALAARGLQPLQRAGLMPAIAPAMIAMPGRLLHLEGGECRFLRYGSGPQEVIYAISRERLDRLLVEAAAGEPAIELHFGRRCIDVEPAQRRLRLRDEVSGAEYDERFECLLAADGAGSAVRSALVARRLAQAQEQPLTHDYKELVIPPLASGAPALEPHALHIWPRGGHMLIALPNTDGSFTATLFLPRSGAPGFAQLTGPTAVRAFFDAAFPDASALLPDLELQFARHPQGRLGTLYCSGWHHAEQVLLLGDAAHAIVPFHGQGLNCGFEDCRVLDGLWDRREGAAAFAQFERQRRPDTDAIAAMALENYVEMRDGVRDPRFAQRKSLATELERLHPGRFIPRYSMVMFHPEIPYAQARSRGLEQERLLDRLMALDEPMSADGALSAAALAEAQRWLER